MAGEEPLELLAVAQRLLGEAPLRLRRRVAARRRSATALLVIIIIIVVVVVVS